MRVGSLFSGIGGFEIGFNKMGFSVAWFVEREPYAAAVLKERWPETPIYGDIKSLDFKALEPVEIITGGFPCQDISLAGKGAGIEGRRSGLWKYYLKAIREIRPKYAIIENVAALAIRGLDVVLADLAACGYNAEWYNIRASDVGAWHRRERLFIISYAQGFGHERQRTVREQEPGIYGKEGLFMRGSETISDTDTGQYKHPDEKIQPGGDAANCENMGDALGYGLPGGNEGQGRFNPGSEGGRLCEFEGANTTRPGKWQDYKIWEVEPEVDRVVNGISRGLDAYIWKSRIKALGNSIVPQVAETIAEAIKIREGFINGSK